MEVEAKFSIPDEQTFQRLLETTSLAGHSLQAPALLHLHDQYLDTADGAILAGGYACRIRREDNLTLATLKGLGTASGAIHRRIELEVELPQALPPQHWPPSAARDLALCLGGCRPLVHLFEADQIRHRRHLYAGDRLVAELNLDRVRLYRGSQTAAASLELEIELEHGGSVTVLERLAEELQAQWGLLPQTQSKFERGLALFGCAPLPGTERPAGIGPQPAGTEAPADLLSAPGIEPDDPMSEAGRKILRFHYQRMVYHEPGTRLGQDIESLHDMRVATRRMRAAFRVFGSYYQPRAVASYQKGLRQTGRALGPVRDLDVFHAKIQSYLSALPPSRQHDLDRFLAVLEARRDSARDRMNAYLGSAKYAHFRERFGQFLETEGLGSKPVGLDGGEPPPYRVRHVAPMAVYQRLAAVRAYDEWVTIPRPPLERLHSLRIACKRLRYTLEFFREVLGPDTYSLIQLIVIVQDHLGNLQDAVVARALLSDFIEKGTQGDDQVHGGPAGAPADATGVEAYLAVKQRELEQLLDGFPAAWQPIQDSGFSKMIAATVAGL